MAQVYRYLGPVPRRCEPLFDFAEAGGALPVLTALLRDDDPGVVAHTADILPEFLPRARESVPALLAALDRHADEEVRLMAAVAV